MGIWFELFLRFLGILFCHCEPTKSARQSIHFVIARLDKVKSWQSIVFRLWIASRFANACNDGFIVIAKTHGQHSLVIASECNERGNPAQKDILLFVIASEQSGRIVVSLRTYKQHYPTRHCENLQSVSVQIRGNP